MSLFYRTVRAGEPQLRPVEVELAHRGRHLVQGISIGLVLGALIVPGRAQAQPGAQPDPTVGGLLPTTAFLETLDVNVVSLEVFVTDRKGKPIEELQREDFEVLQDGEPVELSHFVAPDVISRDLEEATGVAVEPASGDEQVPVGSAELGDGLPSQNAPESEVEEVAHMVLFVDQLEISPPSRQRILEQVRSFVEKAPPRARFLVASYDGQVKIAQEFTDQGALVTTALESLVSLSPRALARQSERRALLREGQAVLRTIGEAQRATNASQFETARSLAQSQLTSLMGQVERYAQRLQAETERGLSALEGFSTALAALPGRKALVHVSEGIAMRPGQELFYAMEEIFQGGRSLDFGNQGQGGDGGGQGGGGQGGGQGGGGQGGGGQGGGGGGGVSFDSDESLNVVSFATRAERFSLDSEVRRLAALANTHRVAFYGIDARGGRAFANDASMNGRIGMLNTDGMQAINNSNRWETLQVLAEETGGALLTGADVDGFLRKVQEDFGAHYSLAYVSPTAGDGGVHEVEVRLRRGGDRRLRRARLRYRRSFVDKPLESRMAARTMGTLLLESDRNPHGIYLETLEPRAGERNQAVVPLVVKIPLAQVTLLPRGAVHGCQARLLVAIEDENGFTGPVQEIPFAIEIPNRDLGKIAGQDYAARFDLVLEQGSRRLLSVGFWDETGGEGSFVRHEVSVGEL